MFTDDFTDMTKMMEIPESNRDQDIHRVRPDYIYGKDMHDYVTNSIYNDWCRWYFPNGIKNRIKDNQLYLVWYNYRDASDPQDSSCSYSVYYIERAPKHIQEMLEMKLEYEKKLKNYQEKYYER